MTICIQVTERHILCLRNYLICIGQCIEAGLAEYMYRQCWIAQLQADQSTVDTDCNWDCNWGGGGGDWCQWSTLETWLWLSSDRILT
jgi:hypothetical protein